MVCCAVLALATAQITGRLAFLGSTWNALACESTAKPEITLTSELPATALAATEIFACRCVGLEHPHALHGDVVGTETECHLAIHEGRILRRDVHHSGRARGQRGEAQSLNLRWCPSLDRCKSADCSMSRKWNSARPRYTR